MVRGKFRKLFLVLALGLGPWCVPACGGDNGGFFPDGGVADGLDSETGAAWNPRDGSPGAPIDAANARRDGGGGMGGSPDAAVQPQPDTMPACVPQSIVLATVGPNGGSDCSFPFTRPYTSGSINLLLSPGWGTVCYAGNRNCGQGASADGWWISGGEIVLCDATCDRFYRQTRAGRLTVRLGCPTETCMHR